MSAESNDALSFIEMRAPCPDCGERRGARTLTNGQDVVRCVACTRFCYCAPKRETGEPLRPVARTWLKPSQKFRILQRACFHCEFCGADLQTHEHHIDHLVSVADCLHFGLTPEETNADENLAALCEECNLGKGSASLPPLQLTILALKAAVRRRTAQRDSLEGLTP